MQCKICDRGEEEVGSDNLEKFISDHKSILQSEIIIISDTGINSIENPAITTGLRGLSYMEVTVTGPNRDLHSGLYGGTVANPINILCDMIASLHNENKKVNIPGFYDHVEEISESQRKMMNVNGTDDKSFKSSIGIEAVMGEKDYYTGSKVNPPYSGCQWNLGWLYRRGCKNSYPQSSPCKNFYAPCTKSELGKHK